MSFQLTIKSCSLTNPNQKATDLYCIVKIGSEKFQTPPFLGKDRVAVWDFTVSSSVKESFLKIELWEENFLMNKKKGDAIINLSKYYSSPGRSHEENVMISKDQTIIAQMLIKIAYIRQAQSGLVEAGKVSNIISNSYVSNKSQMPSQIPSKKLYDTPVPYSNTSNLNSGTSSYYQKSHFQSPYPQATTGSFVKPDSNTGNLPPNQNPNEQPRKQKEIKTTYTYAPQLVAYVTQYPGTGAALIEPTQLVKQVMGQGMEVHAMYDQGAFRQKFTDQYYRPLGWL